MAISKTVYWTSDVYMKIVSRFRQRYYLDLTQHIDSMSKIGRSVGEGITFVPVDHQRLIQALTATRAFAHDDRAVLVQEIAAAATEGEGFRERGSPSLHCQISASVCNIHLDQYGFVAEGPDGQTYYNPDAVQHIFDELVWATDIVPEVRKLLGDKMADVLSRLQPVLPNSTNNYRPAVGGQLVLGSGSNGDASGRWKVTVDVTHGCRDWKCREEETQGGVTLRYTW